MKIKIAKSKLSNATARVQGAISDRSLAQIGIKAENGQAYFSATDRVLAVYCNFECVVETGGTVFVPAKLFSDVVKELPDTEVELKLTGTQLIIAAGKSNEFVMKLPIMEESSWREVPVIKTENSAEISGKKLSYMIDQVQFCVAQDSPRNYGTVAYLHKPDGETCRMVGTDGFRLSYCEINVPMPDSFLGNGVCLSKRAIAEIQRMCSEQFEKVSIAISEDETTLVASVPDYQVFIRLSSVKYPNYMGVLPKKNSSSVLIGRDHLQTVARRVLLAADKSRALQLCFSDSSLTLNSKTTGSSEGREIIPLSEYHGPKFDVAVNGKFLTDIFSTTNSDNLTLHFNQENNEDPLMVVPRSEPSECRSKHVLVPIKQND
jgi:DNA polymerase-3 subunit beta